MTKDEALKLALEALEFVNQTGDTQTFDMCYADKAITAIKEALAQLEQEPVAWADHGVVNWIADKQFKHASLLYTTPPQREFVGLTDEDCKGMSAGDRVVAMWADRTLKEKNT